MQGVRARTGGTAPWVGTTRAATWGRLAVRILIGTIVLGAGVGKALDLPGWVRVLDTYRILPEGGLWPVAVLVILVELALGGVLLAGWRLPAAAVLSVAMHLGYAVLMLVSLYRGLELGNCGCFGVFLARPLTWITPIEDLIVAALSWLLWLLARRAPANPRNEAGLASHHGRT